MKRTAAELTRHLVRKALDVGFGAARMAKAAAERRALVPPGGNGMAPPGPERMAPAGREAVAASDLGGRALVVLLEGLGDSIAFTPALRALRQSFPGAHIDLLVNEIGREIYRTSRDADDLILWKGDPFKGRAFLSLVNLLRANRYGVALTPSLLFRHISLTYLAGARVRAGFNVGGRGVVLNVPLPLDRGKSRIHCYLDLVRALGATERGDHMEMAVDSKDESNAEFLIRRLNLPDSKPLVLIHPGTKQAVNRWPPERYAALADWLAGDLGASVAFTGSGADRPLVRHIRSMMRVRAPSLAGETTLREFAAVLRRCDLFICPDTGAMHLGSAAGAPMVVLMGGRNRPMEWRPLSPLASVLRREVSCSPCYRSVCPGNEIRCMELIAQEDVMREILRRFPGLKGGARSRVDSIAVGSASEVLLRRPHE